MKEFFVADYMGNPAHLFDPPHLMMLGIVLAVNVWMASWHARFTPQHRRNMRYGLVILLLVNETGYHGWRLMTGRWTIQTMLPLHLCALLVWLSIVLLFTKNERIYEFVYFLGIGGAIQALFTPEAEAMLFGFPHYRWFQTFIAHGAIFTTAIYMTVVEGCRPQKASLFRVIAVTNLYLLCVGMVNVIIGSNYLYLAHKPETPTILDIFGPWPWYIVAMEGLGLLTCLLLYLPFAIKDWKTHPHFA